MKLNKLYSTLAEDFGIGLREWRAAQPAIKRAWDLSSRFPENLSYFSLAGQTQSEAWPHQSRFWNGIYYLRLALPELPKDTRTQIGSVIRDALKYPSK